MGLALWNWLRYFEPNLNLLTLIWLRIRSHSCDLTERYQLNWALGCTLPMSNCAQLMC